MTFFNLHHPRALMPLLEGHSTYTLFSFCISDSGHEIKKLLPPHKTTPVRCGVSIHTPARHVGLVCSRSALASSGVFIADSPRILSGPSEDELILSMFNGSDDARYVEHGMPIAHFLILPLLAA